MYIQLNNDIISDNGMTLFTALRIFYVFRIIYIPDSEIISSFLCWVDNYRFFVFNAIDCSIISY